MRHIVTIILLIFPAIIFGQSYKLKTKQSHQFYQSYPSKEEYLDDIETFEYEWDGEISGKYLNGKGTLTRKVKNPNTIAGAYLAKEKHSEVVEFKNGTKSGITKIIHRGESYTRTTIASYDEGIQKGFVTVTEEGLFSKGTITYSANNWQFEANKQVTKTLFENQNNSSSTWIGSVNNQTKTMEGKCFKNGMLTYEGTFCNCIDAKYPSTDGEILTDLSWYLNISTGFTYFANGIKLYCNSYAYGLPVGCATLYYPNGDRIESCSFRLINNQWTINGNGTYIWASGNKYIGEISDFKITNKGYFYDINGSKNYGSFPSYSSNNTLTNIIGIAAVGLAAYGIYKLFTPSSDNSQTSSSTTYTPVTTSSTNSYSGSYSSYNSYSSTTKNYEPTKCYKCSGRGVCLECNGRGSNLCSKCDGKGVVGGLDIFLTSYKDPCSKCEGTGIKKCNDCSGKGTCYKCKGKGTN